MNNAYLAKTIFIIALIVIIFFMFFYLGKYIPLEIALQKTAFHQYTNDYTCLDFSKDLVEELKKNGIQSEVVIGESPETLKNDTRHAWVGVWISPQKGTFTNGFIK